MQYNLPPDIESLFVEINLRKKRKSSSRGHKDTIPYFLSHISKALDTPGQYENILLFGDFNSTKCMRDFCETYNLENLITEPTRFKNPDNPSSIDVILTKFEIYFKRKEPVKINYRSYKNFNEANFRNNLKSSLQNCDQETIKYDEFKEIFMRVLNAHAPKRQRITRGNQQPFMSKTLSKALMHLSKLKHLYNKNPTEMNQTNYKRQRNFCVNLLKREKRNYYNNLDIKVLDDNKIFWQSIKPYYLISRKAYKKTSPL